METWMLDQGVIEHRARVYGHATGLREALTDLGMGFQDIHLRKDL